MTKGKIMFCYEPNSAQQTLIDTNFVTNKQYIKVLDLSDSNIMEFSVKWNSHKAWLTNSASSQITNLHSTTSASANIDINNGYIEVRVLTPLSSPDSTDVTVHWFVSSDDMEYNFFCAQNLPNTRYVAAEGDINEISDNTDYLNALTYGEKPVSFRALLKRYVTIGEASIVAANFPVDYTTRVPLYPRADPKFSHTLSASFKNLYGYLKYAYICEKGSMRYRLRTTCNSSDFSDITVILGEPITSTIPLTYGPVGSTAALIPSAVTGAVSLVPNVNAGLEFEMPYYHTNFFAFACNDLPYGNIDATIYDRKQLWYSDIHHYGMSRDDYYALIDMSTGEDFSLFRFQGAPFYTI